MVSTRDIVDRSMINLKGIVLQRMIERDKNATGRTSRSVETRTVGGANVTEGMLLANTTWQVVGSGSPPGTPVNIASIREWIVARGLPFGAKSLAGRIYKYGTKDWRERNKNVFLESIAKWEREVLPMTEEQAAQNLVDRTEQIILRS